MPATAVADAPLAQPPRTPARRAQRLRRPRLLIALAGFAAVSAIGGGLALVAWRHGNRYVPRELLGHSGFASFLVPGLLLGLVVGGSNLACAILAWRRSRWAHDAALLAGGALTVWIVAELAMMRELHWLHATYGAIGVAVLGLGVRAAWRAGAPRHRWMITVTGAEAAGFLAPALVGIAVASSTLGPVPRTLAIVGAGLIEGLALGAGQAWALPLQVRRVRYALLTSLGAGLVWASVMIAMQVADRGPIGIAVAILAGTIALAGLGTLQWSELRHHANRAARWIGWTALAWVVALPAGFVPGMFVDATTPIAAHVALWGSGGLVMAYVMALITWQGARRLSGARAQK